MAAVNDCFPIGSVVSCTTCFQEEVTGEVLAFDHNSKMLILNKECRSNKEKLNDVYILNLCFVSNVQVMKEVNAVGDGPQKLNLEQLKIRLRSNFDQRERWVKSKNSSVSPEVQELYRFIAKQIKEVSWQGLNIKIFNEVTITPPYRVANVLGNPQDHSVCAYIKKMVEQFYKTQQSQGVNNNTTSDSSSSSSSSASSSSAPSTSVGTSSNATSASPVPAN